MFGIDLEEFDIPEEYGQSIGASDKIQLSKEGLNNLLPLLKKHNVEATFFTTAFWAIAEPEIIRNIATQHEIASHGFNHSLFKTEDLILSRVELSRISGTQVTGFRMPRMQAVPMSQIADAGYGYDSSVNPTYIPGRYNNLKEKRTVFIQNGIYEMPVSVSPVLRIPLFWLLFKNIPLSVYLSLCRQTLSDMGYLIIYFHPWEFIDLTPYRLPWYVKRHSGLHMLGKIDRFFNAIGQTASFISHSRFLESLPQPMK